MAEYKVTRTSEREGKTHKVTGPDGTVKYFGDPDLKNRPNNAEAKAAFYARHKESLKDNPHFRAYARSTWADGGMVEPTPEDMTLTDYFKEPKRQVDSSSPSIGGGDGAGGLGAYEILKAVGMGMPKDIDKEIADSGAKSDVSLNVAEGGLIGSIAALAEKDQYNGFPQVSKYTDSARQQVATASPTPMAEGSEPLEELKRQYKAALANSQATYLVEEQRARFKEEAEELDRRIKEAEAIKPVVPPPPPPPNAVDEAAPAPSGRKPLEVDPDAEARASTTLRLREEISADKELSEDEKTLLRDKIVGLGARKGVKSDVVEATYKDERTKLKAAKKEAPPAPAPAPAAPAAPAPQKVVIPMTLEGGTGDLAVQERKPIDRRREELEAEMFTRVGGAVADPTLTAQRRETARKMADQLYALETATAGLVNPKERVAQIMGETPAPAARQAAEVPAAAAQVPAPAPAPAAQVPAPAPAPKAFVDMSPAEQKVAIEGNANYKLMVEVGRAAGLTDDVAKATAYEDTRQALAKEYTGEVTPEGIAGAVSERPLMAEYERAVGDEAKYRLQVAQLNDLERELTAEVTDKLKKTEFEEGIALQKRLMANAALADQLKTSAVNDLMTARLQKGVPPFGALLGMIGAGLGSTGSVADFVRQRANDELEAQLKVVDRKRTMIGDLLAQGDTLPEAHKKAMAALKLTYATSIERSMPALRDARAKATALAEVAKIRAEALQDLNKVATDRVKADFDIVKTNLSRANASVKPGIEYIKIMADLKKAEEGRKAQLKAAGIRAAGDRDAAKVGKLEAADMPLNAGMYAAQSGKTLNTAQYQRAVGRDSTLAGSFAPVISFKQVPVKYGDKSYSETAPVFAADPKKLRYVGDPKTATALKENTKYAKDIIPALYEIKSIARSSDFRVADKTKQGRLNVLRSQVLYALGNLFKLGTIQEGDRVALENILPAFRATEWNTADSAAAIDQLTTLFVNSIQNTYDSAVVGESSGDWDGKDMRPPDYVNMAATTRAERAGATATGGTTTSTVETVTLKKKGTNDTYVMPKADADKAIATGKYEVVK